MVTQTVPPLGCESNAELVGRLAVKTALTQKRASNSRTGCGELRHEEFRGGRVGRQDARARTRLGLAAATVFVVQFETDALGQLFDGFGETQVLHFLQERVDVTALSATEAVIETGLRTDVERGAALVVKRAEALDRPHARVLE